jgi:hypothetical protein
MTYKFLNIIFDRLIFQINFRSKANIKTCASKKGAEFLLLSTLRFFRTISLCFRLARREFRRASRRFRFRDFR